MEMSEESKKKLLYGAGAIASIIGLYWVLKKSSGSSVPSSGFSAPSGTSSGGGSNSALSAAQIQAATQLTVAQTQKEIAIAQIEASKANNLANANAATSIQKSASLGAAGVSALSAGGAGTSAVKGLFDTLKSVFGKKQELDSQGNPMVLGASGLLPTGEFDSQGNPMILGASGLLGETQSFDPNSGEFQDLNFGVGLEQPYVYPGSYGDFYQGSIGSGDSSWFGSSPNDPVGGDFSTIGSGALLDYEPTNNPYTDEGLGIYV